MGRFRRNRTDYGALERTLERGRPEPRPEFLQALATHVQGSGGRPSGVGSRLAFAAAFTTVLLGAFASFGGVGYAASGVVSTFHAVKHVVVPASSGPRSTFSSAQAQYGGGSAPNTAVKGVKVAGATAASPVGAAKASGTLPFTGISLAGTAVLGILLVVLGLALRRRERRQQ